MASLPTSSAATLWAHLARKETLGRTPDARSFLPPTGPLDKTASSMRVLLHDTQMNLEKFSGNVERLIQDIQKTEQGIKATNLLFEKEQDKLMGDIIDLVNRAQTTIQSSIGTPAQASVFEAFINNVDRRFETLDRRIDTLHAFHQSHSQVLQVQMQTLQSLQTQQNIIISAVAPLLPLVQTLTSRPPPSRVSAVFASPRPSIRQPGNTTPFTGSSAISVRSSVSRAAPLNESGKKRHRSNLDLPHSSSPSAGVVARKKSRVEPSPQILNENGKNENRTENALSKPLRRDIPPLETQDIFRSPKLSITPFAPQDWLASGGQPSLSSNQRVSNLEMENIVKQMSLQKNSGNLKDRASSIATSLGQTHTVTPQSLQIRDRPSRKTYPSNFHATMLPPGRRASGLQQPGTSGTSFIRPKDPMHFKEGKRFIPLGDNDSSEEDDE